MFNILVLCTGNSARSILAEASLNRDGAGRIKAFSAGSNPVGRINPGAIRLLERKGMSTEGYRSKSWDEFAAPRAPEMNLIITVCDSVANEVCPAWPGAPISVHWGIHDPAAAPQEQIDMAFQIAFHRLSARIHAFLALPFETMDVVSLKDELTRIARS